MNMCVDAMLVALVDHHRIAALSHYSQDPLRSTIAPIARQLPVTYETAEEVVALKPDLVLASRHSAIATRNALARVGIRFELLDVPDTIAGSIEQLRHVARLVGAEAAGEAMVMKIEQAIADARPPAGQRPVTGAVYQPGGLSAGAATVTGELMQVAGIQNIAARYGVDSYRPLPLEVLVSDPPELLLVGEVSAGAALRSEKLVRHRALLALQDRMTQAVLPSKLIYCDGPVMIETLDVLVAARERAIAARHSNARNHAR